MTIVGLHDFVKVSISAEFKSFLLIMCIDAPESTTNSRSSSVRFDASKHLFYEGEKNDLYFLLCFEDNFGQSPRCFTGRSLLPLCLFLRPIIKFWSIGVTLMRFTWANHSERRILVLECQRGRTTALGILHIGSVSVCLSPSVKSMKTSAAPYPEIRNPSVVYLMSKRQNRSPCSVMLLILLQHSHCTFVTILFRTFCWAVLQPGDAHKSTSPQICIHSPTWRTGILEDAIFHRMNWCKFLWGNPCRAIETFFHWVSCLWDFGFSTRRMKELGEVFGGVNFARLLTSWRKLQLSPLEHCPLAFHCQQSPRVLCSRFFTLWFLTTALVSKFPFLASKFFILKFCSILLFTIVFNTW